MALDEGYLLAQKAELLAIEAEIQGMVAFNQYHISRDETIAYDESAFIEKAAEARSIASLIMQYR